MNKNESKSKRFDWLPIEMPGVARLIKEKRLQVGDAHVNQCWKRGVIDQEAGWFFAREGAFCIGVPVQSWTIWPELEKTPWTSGAAMLLLKELEDVDGAN